MNSPLSILRFTKFSSVLYSMFLMAILVSCSDGGMDASVEDSEFCKVEINGIFQEVEVDTPPKYEGGDFTDFYGEIGGNFKYPAEARENGIEGDCILHFELSKEGRIENVETIQDPGGGIGEAINSTFVQESEGVFFSPAVLNGEPVKVKKEFLIKFRLEG